MNILWNTQLVYHNLRIRIPDISCTGRFKPTLVSFTWPVKHKLRCLFTKGGFYMTSEMND